MKCIVLLILGCLLLDVLASPIVTPTVKEETKDLLKKETGRQADSQNQVNTGTSSTDDDDDDDEDDDEDLGLDDDDDDDDDEDEQPAGAAAANDEEDDDDDDDGDYFERFFDDILGDDDDDDDDDEDTAASASQPVAVAPVAQPSPPADVAAELPPSENSAGEVQYDEDGNNEVVATIDNDAEKDPSASSSTSVPAPAAPVVQPITSNNEEDDDDDDDDDDDLGIGEDDDDDDDDDEEEDDDDDDGEEDDIEDVIEARSGKKARQMASSPRVPPTFITKYNRYVDNILERINKVLRTGYDPVNVRLHSVSKKEKKPAASKKNKNKKKKKNKNSSRSGKDLKVEELNEVNVTISNVTVVKESAEETTNATTTTTSTTAQPQIVSRAQPPKKNEKTKKNKPGKTKATSNHKNSKPRAKATLYGMATLKRSDDVTMSVMSSHTTVKSRFSIGPLTLKVEKEFGRGAKKELRSATATTTEMIGKINLRLNHGGAATLHSIRVMQPNLLRVDAPEDHDNTREFVWKRSSHIAQIVSQKLTKAARSLLESNAPQPPKPKKKKPANDGILSYFL